MSRSLKLYKNNALKLIFTINYWGIDNANVFPQRVLMQLEALSAILFMEIPDDTEDLIIQLSDGTTKRVKVSTLLGLNN